MNTKEISIRILVTAVFIFTLAIPAFAATKPTFGGARELDTSRPLAQGARLMIRLRNEIKRKLT